MINILSVGSAIEEALRGLSYSLSTLIYQLVAYMYQIFLKLTSARILDSETLDAISSRIGLLLGTIMLFVVIMSTIQLILEPDNLTNKEKGLGNVIKKIVLVVIMLGVSTPIFQALYGLQNTIIESQIISKFLIPYDFKNEKFGDMLSAELFTSFYHMDERADEKECSYKVSILYSEILNSKNYDIGRDCLYETSGFGDNKIFVVNYNWLLSPIVGAGAVYFIFYYCISIGIRTIQLAFLEIISPMAIISYLSPKKETMFSKWMQYYTSTYIDVFIRIAIINLSVFLISIVFDKDMSLKFWDSINGKAGDFSDTIIMIIIIFALLTFAKKAPELLKDLFPSKGKGLGFGVKAPKAMFNDMLGGDLIKKGAIGAAGLGIGAVTGGLGNAIRGAVNAKKGDRLASFGSGLVGGFFAGAGAGATSKGILKSFGAADKAAKAQAKRIADWRAAGGTSTGGRWVAGLEQRLGFKTDSERLEAEKKKLEAENSAYKSYDNSIEKASQRAESQINKGKFNGNAHALKAKEASKMEEIYTQQAGNLNKSDYTTKAMIDYQREIWARVQKAYEETGGDWSSLDAATRQAQRDAYFARTNFTEAAYADELYNNEVKELTKKANNQRELAQSEMKAAKADYIVEQMNKYFNGDTTADQPTVNEVLQALNIVTENVGNGYTGFKYLTGRVDANGNKEEKVVTSVDEFMNYIKEIAIDPNGQLASVSEGLFNVLDTMNGTAKTRQSQVNMELVKNEQQGKAARANQQYSGGQGSSK